MGRSGVVLLLTLMLLSGCGMQQAANTTVTAGSLGVKGAWVRPAVMVDGINMGAMGEATTGTADTMQHGSMQGHGDMALGSTSAAYMVINNNAATSDALVRVSSDVAQTVELHTVETENNVARMRPVQQIPVPANGQVELKPGGFHIMLIGIKQNLEVGSTTNLTLTFQSGTELQLVAPIRERAP